MHTLRLAGLIAGIGFTVALVTGLAYSPANADANIGTTPATLEAAQR